MITGKAAHKEKCNNVAKTIATAAVAVVRALQSPTQSTPTKQDTMIYSAACSEALRTGSAKRPLCGLL